jgi:hypothetical protein
VRNENHPHAFIETVILRKHARERRREARDEHGSSLVGSSRAYPVASTTEAGVVSRPVPIARPVSSAPRCRAAPPPAEIFAPSAGRKPSAEPGIPRVPTRFFFSLFSALFLSPAARLDV